MINLLLIGLFRLCTIVVIFELMIRPMLLYLIDNIICKNKTDYLYRNGWRHFSREYYWAGSFSELISIWRLPFLSYEDLDKYIKDAKDLKSKHHCTY